MGALRLVIALALAGASVPAAAQNATDPVARWSPLIVEAARRFGLPETWIVRVMRAESGGRTMLNGRPIRSRAGAMGLMQLMPGTWAEMRAAYGLGADPDDPRDNILAGAAYLRRMYDRFGYPGLFAAYNAGPTRYAGYLAGRSRLPGETIGYLSAVAGGSEAARSRARDTVAEVRETPRQTLFVMWQEVSESAAAGTPQAPASGLFLIRRGDR